MRVVDILSEEHRVLLDALCCLEQLSQETVRDDRLDGEEALELLEFLERFADGCHQDKEEQALFPVLARRTAGGARTLMSRLLRTHALERQKLEELREPLEAAAYGDPLSRDNFVMRAREYADFQRRHALAEERLLFPLAERFLRTEDDAAITADFAAIDARYERDGGADPRRLASGLGVHCGPPHLFIPRPERVASPGTNELVRG